MDVGVEVELMACYMNSSSSSTLFQASSAATGMADQKTKQDIDSVNTKAYCKGCVGYYSE